MCDDPCIHKDTDACPCEVIDVIYVPTDEYELTVAQIERQTATIN